MSADLMHITHLIRLGLYKMTLVSLSPKTVEVVLPLLDFRILLDLIQLD